MRNTHFGCRAKRIGFTISDSNVKSGLDSQKAGRAGGEHMKTAIQEKQLWSTIHTISAEDRTAMAAMRAIVEPNKGRLQGTAARVPVDGIMEQVVAPAGVNYETDTVGGVSGWWCRPESARTGEAILHIHGAFHELCNSTQLKPTQARA
jgi:hypothetical protein